MLWRRIAPEARGRIAATALVAGIPLFHNNASDFEALARPLQTIVLRGSPMTDRSIPQNIRVSLNVVLALIVVGIALWLINAYVPMAGAIKAILNIVVVVATCVGVLQAFGLWSGIVKLWSDLIGHRIPR